jgi:two-component system, response regulator RegA
MQENTAVLVIDDDADVRYAARIALSDTERTVQLEASPAQIEALLAGTTFHVVMLDMNFLPGERDGGAGLDALARIRAADPHLAVVLMTAYGSLSLAVDALKRGAVDFVLKPWRNDKIIAAVTAAAQITRARRAEAQLDLETIERRAIEQALERCQHNVSLAAAALGLSRPALYRRMLKYGL